MNAKRRQRVQALRTVLEPVLSRVALLADNHDTINDLANEEWGRRLGVTEEGRALNEAERQCRHAIQALRALDDALITAATGVPRKR